MMNIRKLQMPAAIPVWCDNQGALKLIKTGVIKARRKHTAMKFHYSHDEGKRETIVYYYVQSAENQPDQLRIGRAEAC
jgi:hypothetical protein